MKRQKNLDRDEKIVAMIASGMTFRQAAIILGISRQRVQVIHRDANRSMRRDRVDEIVNAVLADRQPVDLPTPKRIRLDDLRDEHKKALLVYALLDRKQKILFVSRTDHERGVLRVRKARAVEVVVYRCGSMIQANAVELALAGRIGEEFGGVK